jgi:hypothetical protein
MTKSSPKELATKAAYNKKPDVQDKRVAQNRARRHAIADGRASVGDGTHVDHKTPLDKGGSTSDSNTRVVPAAKNQGWRAKHPSMYTKSKS